MRYVLAFLCASMTACGGAGGCGGNSDYQYPDTPEERPTPRAARARLTASGIATLADGLPGILAATCAGNPLDGSAVCAMDPDPSTPNRARFYIGNGGTIGAQSYLAFDLDTMQDHIAVALLEDNEGGALRVTIGCNAATNAECRDSAVADTWVLGSLSLVLYPGTGAACRVEEANIPGLVLQSMRFDMKVHVLPDAEGKPTLVIESSDITMRRMLIELDTTTVAASGDPACNENFFGVDLCGPQCAALGVGTAVAEFLFENGLIAQILAKSLAGLLLQELGGTALGAEGLFDASSILPVVSHHARPIGYLFGATPTAPPIYSPSVSGTTGNLGWNIDFDFGMTGARSGCVPPADPPDITLPDLPDVPSVVPAPDPRTGVIAPEPVDLAILLGDTVLHRAAHAMFETGTLCLNLGASDLGELSGGLFVPTVFTMSLLAEGLDSVAPEDAPVNLMLTPREVPQLSYGTGEALPGGGVDSHVKLDWSQLYVELYPKVDETRIRAVGFSIDIHVGLSLVVDGSGDLGVMIDPPIRVDHQTEIYNELLPPQGNDGLAQLVDLFVPMLFSGDAIKIPLDAETLGFPLVPKIRAVKSSDDGRFLVVYMRFCTSEQLADANDALCYDDPNDGRSVSKDALRLDRIGRAADQRSVRVSAHTALGEPRDVQLAYRVDGGMWFNFQAAGDDGTYRLEHPAFALPGLHRLEAVARNPRQPSRWSEIASLDVEIDRSVPRVWAWREGDQVLVDGQDDRTPHDRLLIRAQVEAGDGAPGRDVPWQHGRSIAVRAGQRVTVWAMDESGLESVPAVVAPLLRAAGPDLELPVHPVPPVHDADGCSGAGATPFAALLAGLLLRRRRSSR